MGILDDSAHSVDMSGFFQARSKRDMFKRLLIGVVALAALYPLLPLLSRIDIRASISPREAAELQNAINKCKAAHGRAGPPPNFAKRTRNDRQVDNAKPILLQNVNIWTGKPSSDIHDFGELRTSQDVLIEHGLIKRIAKSGSIDHGPDTEYIAGNGKWLTPGIIDVHVHAAGATIPLFSLTDDIGSLKAPSQPFLRVIDGAKPQDVSLASIASGGVTTALLLPGSVGNIGGQAYPIKMGRFTEEQTKRGGWSRTVDPPNKLILPGQGGRSRNDLYDVNTGMRRDDDSSSWRFVKMACGENPKRFFNQSRLDEAYQFRSMFTKARALLDKQNDFCAKAQPFDGRTSRVPAGSFSSVSFPDDLDLEALVDVMRGKAKVNVHCYTIEDMTSFVAHTNEFRFPLAAFHHADEAYLITDLLKKTYGGPPAIAMFALLADYNVESYYNSPFALSILAKEGFQIHIKSDHEVTDSRRLIVQVGQAHHYGLPAGVALRSVTSDAAKLLGLEHRVGQVKEGMDADVVMWDRFPLKLGANPMEVIIDGNRQALHVDDSLQRGVGIQPQDAGTINEEALVPQSASFQEEAERVKMNFGAIVAGETLAFPVPKLRKSSAVYHNVAQIFQVDKARNGGGSPQRVVEKLQAASVDQYVSVAFENGKLTGTCQSKDASCRNNFARFDRQIDLRGGAIIPGLIAHHKTIGMTDIATEVIASDGNQDGTYTSPIARAADGLMFGGNELRRASATGVRTFIVAPQAIGKPMYGIYTQFDAGAEQLLDAGAVRKREVALSLSFRRGPNNPISTQFTMLREQLKQAQANTQPKTDNDRVWHDVAVGALPLVIDAAAAEIITHLVRLKDDFSDLKLVLRSASEASFGDLPDLLRKKDIGVIVDAIQWGQKYDERRSVRLDGIYAENKTAFLQFTQDKTHAKQQYVPTLLATLHKAGVRVAVLASDYTPANTFLWNTIEAGQRAGLSRADTLDLAVGRVANVLNLDVHESDLVAFEGDAFEYGARPLAMMSQRGVDLMNE